MPTVDASVLLAQRSGTVLRMTVEADLRMQEASVPQLIQRVAELVNVRQRRLSGRRLSQLNSEANTSVTDISVSANVSAANKSWFDLQCVFATQDGAAAEELSEYLSGFEAVELSESLNLAVVKVHEVVTFINGVIIIPSSLPTPAVVGIVCSVTFLVLVPLSLRVYYILYRRPARVLPEDRGTAPAREDDSTRQGSSTDGTAVEPFDDGLSKSKTEL